MKLGIVRSRPWRAFQRIERADVVCEPSSAKRIPTAIRDTLTALVARGEVTPAMSIKTVHWRVLEELDMTEHPPYGLRSPETVRIVLRGIKGFER